MKIHSLVIFWVMIPSSLVYGYQIQQKTYCLLRRWRQYARLKYWYPSVRLQGITFQKTVIFILTLDTCPGQFSEWERSLIWAPEMVRILCWRGNMTLPNIHYQNWGLHFKRTAGWLLHSVATAKQLEQLLDTWHWWIRCAPQRHDLPQQDAVRPSATDTQHQTE